MTKIKIWDGSVPSSSDEVNFNEKGTYTIRVTSSVTIKSLTIGTSIESFDAPTLRIVDGIILIYIYLYFYINCFIISLF